MNEHIYNDRYCALRYLVDGVTDEDEDEDEYNKSDEYYLIDEYYTKEEIEEMVMLGKEMLSLLLYEKNITEKDPDRIFNRNDVKLNSFKSFFSHFWTAYREYIGDTFTFQLSELGKYGENLDIPNVYSKEVEMKITKNMYVKLSFDQIFCVFGFILFKLAISYEALRKKSIELRNKIINAKKMIEDKHKKYVESQ